MNENAVAPVVELPVESIVSNGASERKNAPARIKELLGEIKQLKAQRTEAQREIGRLKEQAMAGDATELRSQVEILKGELLAVCAENSDFKAREEQSSLQAEEDRKAVEQRALEHRTLCFAALIDCATQTGFRKRMVDFDTRLRHSEEFISTALMEAVLMFPKNIAPELAYALASDHRGCQRLSGLPAVAQIFALSKIAGSIEDGRKMQILRGDVNV
jgi:ubiquitin